MAGQTNSAQRPGEMRGGHSSARMLRTTARAGLGWRTQGPFHGEPHVAAPHAALPTGSPRCSQNIDTGEAHIGLEAKLARSQSQARAAPRLQWGEGNRARLVTGAPSTSSCPQGPQCPAPPGSGHAATWSYASTLAQYDMPVPQGRRGVCALRCVGVWARGRGRGEPKSRSPTGRPISGLTAV